MVLSSAIAGSQTIAEVCLHMIANDRRLIAICDLRSAIIWKPAFNVNAIFPPLDMALMEIYYMAGSASGQDESNPAL